MLIPRIVYAWCMPSLLLWLKAFHVVFVVTWFAGLFYLPRLFIYHVSDTDSPSLERFVVMERRLFGIMTIGGTLAVVFGMSQVMLAPAYAQMGWFQVKMPLVALLIGYHIWCYRLMVALREGRNRRSERWLRLFNEAPALFLIAIVILAVAKPF